MSENKKKILKNSTLTDIELSDTGLFIPAEGQIIIEPSNYPQIADDLSETPPSELYTKITSGDIIVNDGVFDITVANGFDLQRAVDYLKFPDTTFNIRFLSDPERVNGFDAKNAQEAIEEARASAFDNDTDTLQFGRQGQASNGTYLLTINNVVSYDSPDHFPHNAVFNRLSVSNSGNNPDPFTIKVWRASPDHSERIVIYTETFDSATANWSGHSGYTQADQNIVIPVGYGIYLQVSAVGNPKPANINILVWTRKQ